jgi:hypothetical protein
MKKVLLIAIILIGLSCSKDQDKPEDKNITARAVVWNEQKTSTSPQHYWKPGILFNKAIITNGVAEVTWYFPAGWINGNPSNRYTHTLSIDMTGDGNGYFEFSNWQVDYTMIADSIRIKSLSIDGDYSITLLN